MRVEPIIQSNRPVEFIAEVSRAAGWHGDLEHIEVIAGHNGAHQPLAVYAEAFRCLGLNARARRRKLSRLTQDDMPCLYQDARGTVRLAREIGPGGVMVCDENVPEPSYVPITRSTVVVLDVTRADGPTKDLSTTVSTMFMAQSKSIVGVIVASSIINWLGISSPLVVLTVYDTAIPTQSVDLLWSLAELALALVALELTLRLIRAWLIGDAGAQIERTLSRALFQKLSRLPVQKIHGASMFQQMARLKQFESVRDALTGSFILTLVDLPFAIIFLAVISFFSIPVTLLLLGASLVFGLLAIGLTRWQLRFGAAASRTRQDYDALQYEIARNRRMIQNFNLTSSFEARAARALEKADRAGRRQRVVQATIQAGGQALVALVGIGAVALSTIEAMAQTLTFGGLIVIVTLVWRVLGPIQQLFVQGPRVVGMVSSLRQVSAVLGQEEEMRRLGTQVRAKTLNAPLEMKNVFLRFDAVHEPALANVTLTINPGEHVALCGPARSGKTCLLNCFAKLMVPGSGSVLVGSIEYRQLAVEDVRQAVSFCTHDNWFFDMTLRDNMRMGNPTASDEEIADILKRVDAIRDLRRFHDGLDTVMTQELVARSSTVQLKTLSIARALCRKTPIYLFDDAMVGLSSTRANHIWSVLDEMGGAATVVAVTNHVEQMAMADRVICLSNGRVVMDGAGLKDAQAASKIIQGS